MLRDVAWELRNGRLWSTTAITGQPPPATAAGQEVLEDSGPLHLPEFEYVREDEGQVSIALLEAMRTNKTVRSLDLRLSYFGGQPLREGERRGSGVLMRRCPLVCERLCPAPPRGSS